LRYALTFKELKRSLLDFNKHLNIYFSEIDTQWLKRYEIYLRQKNLGENTIGIRFRTFRVLYNIAIERKIVKSEYYPFKSYKVSKLHKDTIKRAIPKNDIIRILNYKTTNENIQFAIDIFSFSYFCGGINFKDIAHLTNKNLIDNTLVYYRKKTKKLIKIPIKEPVIKIINKYQNSSSIYLFPIFSEYHTTELKKENRLHKVIEIVNRKLKEVGIILNLPIPLTTYVARHSYATVLKRSGVDIAIISETLGHSDLKTTQIYLDSFENEQIDKALENLL